jgi:N-acetylglucosamine kinase
MSFVCGLDSGGTKTLIAFADRDGRVFGPFRSASLDPSKNIGWPVELGDALRNAAAATSSEANIDTAADPFGFIAGAAFGLSFYSEIDSFSRQQREAAASLLGARAIVDNDVRIAFDGAFATPDAIAADASANTGGILVLAGTGSMVWASRNGPDDPHIRIGGWGDAFGDEGSAFWIGREALALASMTLDGRRTARTLTDAILASLSIRPDALLAWCYELPDRRARFAALAPVVTELAEQGNADARILIERVVDHLADHVAAAERQLSPHASVSADSARPNWSHAGSVFNCRLLVDLLSQRLHRAPMPARLPPIGGSLLRAARHAHWPVDAAWLDRLSRSLAQA